jgi:type IV pilus assembly protein PilA
MHKLEGHRGFTIVELLIVIVVVGILAAISIAAYNGIQGSAKTAATQSEVTQAVREIEAFRVATSSTDTYPVALDCSETPDAQTICLQADSGAELIYTYDSDTNSYCVSVTRESISYMSTTTDTSPSEGACPNETITNLIVNPSLETSGTAWELSAASLSGGRTTVAGAWRYHATRTSSAAAAMYASRYLPSTVTAGETYTASARVTSSVDQTLSLRVRRAGTTTDVLSASTAVTANTPTRISVTGSVGPWTSVYVALVSASGTVGNTLTMDEVMLTLGSTVYSYADGNSPGWSWSGTQNESVSSGPAP